MTLQIKFGIPQNQRIKVARMFYDTFADKFHKIFGTQKKFIHFTLECLRDDRTLVAFKDGQVVGVAGLHYDGRSFIDANMEQAVKVFGLATLRVVLFGGLFFFKKADQNEVFIESLAVAASERGKGIGTNLIHAVIDYAKSNGFSQIRLEVVETNKKAKKLYERIGFTEDVVQYIPSPFNRIMGFGSVTEMTYTL
jgi:ribosomal protein S18 acetylase RimI-like enzyme